VPDRLDELEARVRSLTGELEQLRGRVGVLEARGAAAPTAAPTAPRRRAAAAEPATALGAAVQASDATIGATAPLVGQMLLILAGAFVLRALTENHTLAAPVGVALGFAYAGGVHALAARAARPLAAAFHGLAAVLIGFPLIYEATARHQLLGPVLSALLLVAVGGSVLGMAAWRRLPAVAWLGTIGVVLTAIGLMVATRQLVPATLALVALGLITLWLGYLVDWHALRWPVAAVADLAFVVVAARAVTPAAAEGPGLALLTGGLLVVAYLGSFAARTLYLGRSVLVAGLGGAAWVTARSGAGTAALGVGTLALAAACYGVAFAFVGRRQKGSANFYFYSSVALAFALAGTWLALPGAARGAALGLLAVTAAVLARAQERGTLAVHAALFGLSAAGAAGLLGHADLALFSSAAVPWPALPLEALGVLACLVAAALVTARTGGRATLLARLPQLGLDVAVALSAAGVVAGWAALALGPPGPEADLGLVGTARTAVLASGAVLAAWLGRREAGREAGWLAWPLLAALGLKLLLEDLPRGRPATLIFSFAFTGAALMLVPRLRARRSATPPPAPAAGDA
jgi:hypothetical protein